MAMSAPALAAAMAEGLNGPFTSPQLLGKATALIAWLATANVTNAPDTITGIAPASGGPLSDGAGANGMITALVPDVLVSLMQTNMGLPFQSPELKAVASAYSIHFMGMGIVSFATGNITGTCANSSSSPGPLTGQGANGEISGLDGTVLANLMAGLIGRAPTSSPHMAMASKIVNYIMQNAEVTYPPGSVTGVCPGGGGPITGGTGTGGIIT